MTAIRDLPNLGPKSAEILASVDIHTRADLEAIGAVEAYRRAKLVGADRVSLNLLWAMQGALLGIPWNQIPDDMKADLKRQIRE
jgi:DNA transformation protein